jgi:signal transduction histidine kinase
LESTIAALKPADAKRKEEIAALEGAVEFLKISANQALRYGHAWDQPEFERVYVGEIVTRLKRLYRDRRLRWLIRPTPELRADPWLIEQIVVELVVNALRFAPGKERSGRIVVRTYSGWTLPQIGKRRRAIVIQVQDNGPGVPRSQKQLIFQPYRTIDESRLGLGLSIVMRAVQAHGGLVFECGREGHGACFRVLLPVNK